MNLGVVQRTLNICEATDLPWLFGTADSILEFRGPVPFGARQYFERANRFSAENQDFAVAPVT